MLQSEHSSYYEIVVTTPKPLDLTWILELIFYLDYCTMLLMVCCLSNCFSFYMHINLSTVVCYMHGVFDKIPQKDCIMWHKWGKLWFYLMSCWHNNCFFFFFTDNNFVLAYCSCYDNMVLRNQLSLTLSLSPSYCLHSFEQLTCYSFWKFLSTILSPKIGLKLRFCISCLELPLSLRGLHFYFYTFLLNV